MVGKDGIIRWAWMLALAFLVVVGAGRVAPAAAHPHVWVSFETTVEYDKGTITGLRHRWTFDELYTTMAIQGLDANNDGNYDRNELVELAKVNIEGLEAFDYFTFVRLAGQPLKIVRPTDFFLEYKDGVLALVFVLPLEKPVLAEAEGFTFMVSDPSYFIAFDPAKEQPIRLSQGAPAGCQVTMGSSEMEKAELERLGQAFQQELGGAAPSFTAPRNIAVSCPKS